MRLIVFFDLPTETVADKNAYRNFRTFLLKEGFIMMQQSVYTKLALNNTTVSLIRKRLGDNVPAKGLIQLLVVTEKQFAEITYLVGESTTNIVDSTDRYILI